MIIAAVFAAKLLDPITAILGIIFGAACGRWWLTPIGAVIAAALAEAALFSIQSARQFDTATFAIELVAAETWVAIGFRLLGRRIWARNESPDISAPQSSDR